MPAPRFGLGLGFFLVVSAALADDGRSQLDVPGQAPAGAAGSSYRILYVGDSITRHGTNPAVLEKLHWDHVAGMAASTEANDYAHRLTALIEPTLGNRKAETCFPLPDPAAQAVPGYDAGSVAGRLASIGASRPIHPELVVIQLGEHEKQEQVAATLLDDYRKLLAVFDDWTPKPLVICTGTWSTGGAPGGAYQGWSAEIDNDFSRACAEKGVPFVSIQSAALDPSCRGAGDIPGVQWHPNDKGHEQYALRLFAAYQKARAAASPRP